MLKKYVNLNQHTLCAFSLSKKGICNILRMAEETKLKISGNVEGNVGVIRGQPTPSENF